MPLFDGITGAYVNIGIREGDAGEPVVLDFLAEHGLTQWPKTGTGWRYWANTTSTGLFGEDYDDTIPENIFANVTNGPLNSWITAPLQPHAVAGQDNDPYLLAGQLTARGIAGVNGFADADGYPVYDPDNDCIHWYDQGLWHRTIYNDLTVGPYVPAYDVHGNDISTGKQYVGPSVVREVLANGSIKWHCWYNDDTRTPLPSQLMYRFSVDDRAHWSDPVVCSLPTNGYVNYWHPTFKRSTIFPHQVDMFGGGYGREYPEYTGPYSGKMVATLAHCTFEDPTSIKVLLPDNILMAEQGYDAGSYQWQTASIYRTCGLIRLNGTAAEIDFFPDLMVQGYQMYESTYLKSGTLVADALILSVNPARLEDGKIKVAIGGVDYWFEGITEHSSIAQPANVSLSFTTQPYVFSTSANGFSVKYGVADVINLILATVSQIQPVQVQSAILKTILNVVSASSSARQLETIVSKISQFGNVASAQLTQIEAAYYGELIAALSGLQSNQIEALQAEISNVLTVDSTQRAQLETIRNLISVLGMITNPKLVICTPIRKIKEVLK